MTSRITIEVDFENNNQPMIRVIQDRSSDDVRDKLLKYFAEKLGYASTWLKVKFPQYGPENALIYTIHPITPEQLEEEAKIMMEQVRVAGTPAHD